MNNDMKNMVPAQIVALARFCQFALGVLNARLFTLAAIGVNAWLFAWVMYAPHYIRLAGACAFAILVGWPVYVMERARRVAAQSTQGEAE